MRPQADWNGRPDLGSKAVSVVIVDFIGCTLGNSKCSSAGAAEGEVDT